MTKVKICGITNADDARFCASLGADFLGFVFVPSSPRYIAPEKAAEILLDRGDRVAAAVQRVGVFRDESPETIRRIVRDVGLDIVQLHGNESDADVAAIGVPVIKAFRVDDVLPETVSSADWLMFDSGGGTGRVFDWSLLARYRRGKPFFLAGGITPENVAAAIAAVQPDAIDVASGVERAPGIKDHDKVRELFERVRKA
jgi:phosphoribosylanthranilate isomerase